MCWCAADCVGCATLIRPAVVLPLAASPLPTSPPLCLATLLPQGGPAALVRRGRGRGHSLGDALRQALPLRFCRRLVQMRRRAQPQQGLLPAHAVCGRGVPGAAGSGRRRRAHCVSVKTRAAVACMHSWPVASHLLPSIPHTSKPVQPDGPGRVPAGQHGDRLRRPPADAAHARKGAGRVVHRDARPVRGVQRDGGRLPKLNHSALP